MGTPNLPAVPSPSDPVPEILDGEIVGEQTTTAAVSGAVAVLPPHAAAVIRHSGYVAAGAVVLARRYHHRRTFHHRAAEAAMATGDHETALKWKQQHALERHQRHERLTGRVEAFVALVKVSPWLLAGWLIMMGLTGMFLAIARHDWRLIGWPWLAMARAVAFAVTVATATAYAVLILIPLAVVAVLAALYVLGRSGGRFAPGWAVTSADASLDVSVDERTVTLALGALGLRPLNDYLKNGMPLQFIVPCRLDGRGTYCEARMPLGVTTEEVGRRRVKLAAGLYRLPREVWPSTGGDASHLKLWIADKGALAEGAGPYPLAAEGLADVFKGLPFGRTLRGDPIRIPVIGRNTMCGGMPEQGKSNGARVVACGYALDITTELRIWVPDTNFDFEPFKPRCSQYIMGAEDEFIEQILGGLEELKDEVQARGQLLVDFEQQEVTRQLAAAGVGLHPVWVLLEEAHVAIQHRKHGKAISQLLCEIVKLDRKRGIHLMVSTQAPTRDSMPRDVTRNCSNGIAFAVGDHVANDALLGQGAYAGGHRATELIPGTDRGTALCKGFSGERSEIVQVHRLDVSRDSDQVTPLVRRALAEMDRLGRAVPGTDRPRVIEQRDLLSDLDAVMGSDRVRLADLPALLRDHAPAWVPYRTLTGADLGRLLGAEGVRWTNTGNVPKLDPADLRSARHRGSE